MWVLVGLGNPGSRYARTRHNAGFLVVAALAERYRIELKIRELYRVGRGSLEGNDVILMEPLTFMNRSGLAVRYVMRRYALPAERLIVIQDDIDMETGKVKIREKGSSGGHKGIESIIQTLGTREFIRVKIGVGREEGVPVEDYVLSKFRKEEMPLIQDAVGRAAEAVEVIIKSGVGKAMNTFN